MVFFLLKIRVFREAHYHINMGKFIKHIIAFSVFCLLLMTVVYFINIYNFNKSSPSLANTRVLILGDSHPQFAVNPSLFESAVNLSQAAEPYALSYWKLKFLAKDKTPDTLVLGFAPQNLAGFNDLKFINETWANEMFMRAYPIKSFLFLEPIDISYGDYARVFFLQMLLVPRKNHVNFMGEFSESKKSNLKNVDNPINRHYFSVDYKISQTNEIYLDSILAFCRDNNIVPVLVSPPVHKDYYQKIPKENMEYYNRRKMELKENGVLVIDETATIFEDSLFFNFDHLNVYGANKFTELLMNRL